MRKTVSSLLWAGIALILCLTFCLPQTGSASQSNRDLFYSYTPSGDPAIDIGRVGYAQNNRTQGSMGYPDEWCSYFVGDCAYVIGQSDVVPYYAYSGDLHNAVISKGGYEVSTPQAGDLVFYYSGTFSEHVGIMVDSKNCVSGNMWTSGSSKVETWDYTQICKKIPNRKVVIVRPNYAHTYLLDVNFNINDKDTLDLSGIGGSFTITVNGSAFSGKTDFASRFPAGSTYSISNIQAGSGYVYSGVSEGALSGTLGSTATSIRLCFYSTYAVKYDANGGTGAPSSQSKVWGQALTLVSAKPSRTGYTFKGWASSSGATAAEYQPGASYTANKSITLYAVWELNEYDITYNLNGGTGSIPKQHVTGKTTTLTTVRPTRARYDFLGWSKSKNAIKATYLPGASYTGTGNVTLYAVWKRRIETVSRLPAGLTTINNEALSGTVFDAIIVPKSVKTIGSGVFGDSVIYCYSGSAAETYAKDNGLPYTVITDGWVRDSEVPAGAKICSEKWTYTKITGQETTTSTSSSLDGWTQVSFEWRKTNKTGTVYYAEFPSGFDQSNSAYQSYNHSQYTTEITGNTKREYGSPSFWQYCYWHWCWVDSVGGEDRNVTVEPKYGTASDGKNYIYFDYILTATNMSKEGMSVSGLRSFDNLWSSYHHPEYNKAEYASWWWYRFELYKQTYTEYEKLFTYVRESSETLESATEPTGDGISNVQHWVKYGF